MKLILTAALFGITLSAFAQQRTGSQPAREILDLDMYSRIRAEGFEHSQVMDYATALFDDIGPRLTGSPNLDKAYKWTQSQLIAMSATAHLESWGDFGMGWRQVATSVDMSAPDTAVFIAQATPWSPGTPGNIHAEVIAVPYFRDEKDFDSWKGKLTGKAILYGRPPAIEPDPKPALEHYDDKKLDTIIAYPPDLDFTEQHIKYLTPAQWASAFKYVNFKEQIAKFFADQGAVALFVSSYGGDAGIMKDDNNTAMGQRVFMPDHKQPIPSAVLANEAFGRMARLLQHNVPVSVDVNIRTEFIGDHQPGQNVIGEIPGVDPKLKDEVVMAGGHLDSWPAGTGATDDGAGVIVAMEAMRILAQLHVHPRRTIRVALWSGEEQGEFGSLAYVRQHFATVGLCTSPEQEAVPEFLRQQVGPIITKPEYDRLSVYFNIDNGGGRLFGVYAEGNAAAADIFSQWIAPLKDLGVTTVSLRPSGSSDQDSFNDAGLPGFQFIQDPRDYETRSVHSNQDTYERLSPDDLKQASVVEAIFLYNAAMRDQNIPRKPMPTFPKAESINLMPDAKAAR